LENRNWEKKGDTDAILKKSSRGGEGKQKKVPTETFEKEKVRPITITGTHNTPWSEGRAGEGAEFLKGKRIP